MAEGFAFAKRRDRVGGEPPAGPPWTILIVDDDPEVHSITKLALHNFSFQGRPANFLDAHSATQARAILEQTPDVALVLLDVVMETDDAGLQLVQYIRRDLGNHRVRIVLRTGQPGQAPERSVILGFDINDYKTKTELTAQQLFTTLISALRSYRDLLRLESHRSGLQKMVASVGVVGDLVAHVSSMRDSMKILAELVSPRSAADVRVSFWRVEGDGRLRLRGGSPMEVDADVRDAMTTARACYSGNRGAIFRGQPGGSGFLLLVEGPGEIEDDQKSVLEVFAAKLAAEEQSQDLYAQLRQAQEATILSLARLAEYKDTDTADHLRRVEVGANGIVKILGERGVFPECLDQPFRDQIGPASVLHDVGKVGISEKILLKPGPLDPEEWAIMRSHTTIGGDILSDAARLVGGRNYLALAAEIALSHHEKYDGTGYPDGLSGEDIPLSARIVAVVDVFDALTSKRPYKEPWPQALALDLLRDEAGKHFDPHVVVAFLEWQERQRKKLH